MVRFTMVVLVVTLLLMAISLRAYAFDYLEHSYLTDQACWKAQQRLSQLVEERPEDHMLRARFMALAMTCPDQEPDQYCIDRRKAVTSHINRVGDEPWVNRSYPLTMGDYSGLGDHLSRLGPIRGLTGARKPGLTGEVMRWFAEGDVAVGGVVGRVGRRACSKAEEVPWDEIDADIDAVVEEIFARQEPRSIPASFLSPLARAPVNPGPREQTAIYSISNPHYLDLVLRNHNHFGEEAFDAWLGFHSASMAIASRRCETTYGMGYRQTRRLADGLTGFEQVQWRALSDAELARTGCVILAEHARIRLIEWAERTEDLPPSVQEFIDGLYTLDEEPDALIAAQIRGELDMVVTALTGLIFAGSGLHYLQDGFAGGHIRTIRGRGGLGGVRYDHDHDNEEGVSAVLRTRGGDYPFVAFGDMRMLGSHSEAPEHCDWARLLLGSPSPEHISACLLRHQRGLVVATSAASLIDWALGGLLFEPEQGEGCTESDLEAAICDILPLTAVAPAGTLPPRAVSAGGGLHQGGLNQGNLPVPAPPFAYESLVTTLAFDVAGTNTQYGLQLTILSELDTFANWLTSYRAALLASTGFGDRGQLLTEFSYNFHLRWSARVMFEAGAAGFMGFRGVGEGLSFMAGAGPSAGIVALPEGWVKIPLELSLSFRMPMTFFTSSDGFFGESFGIEAFWLQFGLGLAFM